MPTTSGTDIPNNNDRKYTAEQKAAVIRIRNCPATAFYEILSISKTANDGEIKKAYRKQSLLTHPDKNGYEGSDEAFKMVSRAFQILSDPEKKSRHDKFGGDPESRFPSGPPPTSSSFSGFSGFPRNQGYGPMFEDEISPEELFSRFFGGGPFSPFGGGLFDSGPQFMFNVGGPGIRVHQFGGPRARRRPRETSSSESSLGAHVLLQFLPFLILFLFPLLSSLFFGSTSSGPSFRMDSPDPPYTLKRTTPNLKLDYFLDPLEVNDYGSRKFYQLDHRIEVDYVSRLQDDCERERSAKERMIQSAQGWFFPDTEKIKEARSLELRSCKKLRSLG